MYCYDIKPIWKVVCVCVGGGELGGHAGGSWGVTLGGAGGLCWGN